MRMQLYKMELYKIVSQKDFLDRNISNLGTDVCVFLVCGSGR